MHLVSLCLLLFLVSQAYAFCDNPCPEDRYYIYHLQHTTSYQKPSFVEDPLASVAATDKPSLMVYTCCGVSNAVFISDPIYVARRGS
jgi:hypothetical protein